MRKTLFFLLFVNFYITTNGAVNLTQSGTNIPINMYRGLTYPISVTVTNSGSTSTSTTFTINISINTVGTYNGSQMYLGEITVVGGLAAGASKTLSKDITIPCNYSTGTRYILIGVNPSIPPRAVIESDYSDNDLGYGILVKTAAELIPLTYSLSTTSIDAGNSVTATFSVNNVGGTAAGNFTVGFYLSNSTTLNLNQATNGTYSISSVGACSQTSSLSKILVIPSFTCPGTYYLHMWIDNGTSISEVYDNNNFQYKTLSVTGTSPPPAPVTTFGDQTTPEDFPASVTPTLTWTGSGNNFWVQISKCPYGSSNIVYSADCISGHSHTVSENLLSGRLYRWNMYGGYACCESQQSDISNTRYFNIPPVVTANGATNICPGGSVELLTDFYSDATYQWKLNGTDVPGANFYHFFAALPGSYTVVNSFSCGTTSLSNAISVTAQACCDAPTEPAINITFSDISSDQVTVHWTNGNGSKHVVKINNLLQFSTIPNGTDPTANPVYQGEFNQVVYNGSDNSVTVTGLQPGVGYYFSVTEGNCSGNSSVYLNTSATNNPKSIIMPEASAPPVANFSTLNSTVVTGHSADLIDLSSNNPTSWNWIVEREKWDGTYVITSSSTDQYPTFSFTVSACYRITLTVSNAAGSDSRSRECFIYATPDLNAPIPADVTRAQQYYTYNGGDPVNAANGVFTFSMREFSIHGIKSTLNLERRYFSNSRNQGIFGLGWFNSFDIKVSFNSDFDWAVQYPDGHVEHFVPYKNGETQNLYPGNFDVLSYTAENGIITSYMLVLKNGTHWNFNRDGKIVSIVDLEGNQTTFNYTGSQLASVIAPGGRSLQFSYSIFNQVTSVTDDLHRTVYFYYDANNLYLDSTKIANATTSFRYGANGMTEIYDPMGNRIVQNLYNSQGQVYEQYDAENHKTTFQYNTPSPEATTITNSLGKTRVITHDSKSRCIEILNEINNTEKFRYSINNTLDTTIDARNLRTIIEHDGRGNSLKIINAKGFFDSTAYNVLNKPEYIQDGEGNVTRISYDAAGNPTQIILSTNDIIQKEYDSHGLDTIIKDPRGFKTRKIYNSFGDLTQIITPTSSISFSYDVVGRLDEITDSYGRKDSLFWNHFDQLIKRRDKMGFTEEFTYDANGNQVLYKDKEGRITSTEFNKFDKPIRIIEPQNHIIEMVYDDNQRPVKVRDANGHTVIFNRDDVGQITSIFDSTLGTIGEVSYDESGNIIRWKDGLNKTWTNSVDEINRITSTTNPLGDSVQYKYNKANQIIEYIDEEGKSVKWHYDGIGRHSKSIDAYNNYVELFYNQIGRVDSIRDARGNIRNKTTYDGSGRPLTIDDGFGKYIISWDSTDIIKSITDPDNKALEEFHNQNYELTDITTNSTILRHYSLNNNGEYIQGNSKTQTGSVIRNQLGWVKKYTDTYSNIIEHQYDSIGQVTKIIYPGGKVVEYKYNSMNKCTEVKDWNNRIYTIGRDNNGGITNILYPNNYKTEIMRDDAYRIKAWINKNDTNGIFQSNLLRLSKTGNVEKDSGVHILPFILRSHATSGVYDADDRLQTYDTSTFTNNNSGQRTGKIISSNRDTYSWSAVGELDTISHMDINTTMEYDAFGERITKKSGGVQIRYIIEHYLANFPLVLQERNSANEEKINYLYIPGEGIVLGRDSAGSFRFYHHTVSGNTAALSDISGTITDRYEYSILTDTFCHSGYSMQPMTWMGMYGVQNDGNSIYYLHARYFDGKTGTFISKDPHSINYLNTQDINRYVYGYNNPLKYSDPSGLVAQNNISYEDIYVDGVFQFRASVRGAIQNSRVDFTKDEWGIRPDAKGFFTYNEALKWAQNHSNEPLYYNTALAPDLRITQAKLKSDLHLNFLYNGTHDISLKLIFGNNTLISLGDNSYRLGPDVFDYDYQNGFNPENLIRNDGILIARLIAGFSLFGNTPSFPIYTYGSILVK